MRKLLVAFIVMSPLSLMARDLDLIYKNNRAVDLFKLEKRQEAFDQFLGLTAKDPNDVQLKFNLAATLQTLGEEEKAIKLNTAVIKDIDTLLAKATSDAEKMELLRIKFAALFNRGVSHQVMKNTDGALESYQAALALMPDSQEIKTNIEMLFSGGGQGGGKDKKKEKGEGEGEGDPNESEDQQQKENNDKQKQQQQQQKPKEFDQKYMSNEDLKRIMEELNDQEQKIRAKMERKGVKSAPKDKEW